MPLGEVYNCIAMWLCMVYAWLKGDFMHDCKIAAISLFGSKATPIIFSELFIILYFDQLQDHDLQSSL